MKIGVLAGLLEKPADELVTTLNVTDENDELSEEVVVEQIKGLLDSKIKETKRLAKEEGRGWGAKETYKSVTSKLKALDLSGDDFDSMIEELSTKINSGGSIDKKTTIQIEQLKTKNEELQKNLNQLTGQIETEKKMKVVTAKINPLLTGFDGTEKAKSLALESYLKNVNIEIDGDEITLLDKDGKWLKESFEEHSANYFSELFEKKKDNTAPPKNPESKGKHSKTTKTRNELLIDLRSAKTPEERASIKEALDSLEKN